ncbi:hypothetical protein G5714_009289 [Onychostoma macrolepis]|uniref:Uncharacterized protein n=1 Tax=Onychostoma macrolepis TaxID=369639 RepID=A0A7J6CRT8_9TELE|nr:hypothetical protein G5714_009289 [Onychostoma macrolepis]
MSRVPFLSGALQGASPTRPLSLSTSVPPAHAGGPTGAEDVYDAPLVVGGFLSSDNEPSRSAGAGGVGFPEYPMKQLTGSALLGPAL